MKRKLSQDFLETLAEHRAKELFTREFFETCTDSWYGDEFFRLKGKVTFNGKLLQPSDDDVDIYMGTFSKSFAALGGFIATDSVTANYLRHNSRSYIFSASITPASTAAVNAALDIMESEPERIEHLWKVTNYALDGFRNIGCEIGHTSTPIIPLFIRDNDKTFAVTRDLLEDGIFVNPVVSPAVPSQDTLIRFSLMATHTIEQVDRALECIQKVFKKYDIIK